MLKKTYELKKADIEKRLEELKENWNKDEVHIFGELVFCLFTPQSKAKSCWNAVEKLKETGLLYTGTAGDIIKWMGAVRFNKNKSQYVVEARELFTENGELNVKGKLAGKTQEEKRQWLVKNVKGMGLKEASHFLRNVGFFDLAILDRHILKNLIRHGVIEMPKSLTEKKYLEIEGKFKEFAEKQCIPMSHLDLLFWSEEAGEVFK